MPFDPTTIRDNRYPIRSKFHNRPFFNSISASPSNIFLPNNHPIVDDLDDGTLYLIKSVNEADAGTTFKDYSKYNHTITLSAGTGPVEHDTARSVLNSSSSLRFYDATGDGKYLIIPKHPLMHYNQDFTLEFWMNLDSTQGSNRALICHATSSVTTSSFYGWTFSTSIFFRFYYGAGTYYSLVLSATADRDDTWRHYAVTREGNTYRTFRNGILQNEYTGYDQDIIECSSDINLGRNISGYGTYSLWGWLQNVQFTPGVAKYTDAFTTPTVLSEVYPPKNFAIVKPDEEQVPVNIINWENPIKPPTPTYAWTFEKIIGKTIYPQIGDETLTLQEEAVIAYNGKFDLPYFEGIPISTEISRADIGSNTVPMQSYSLWYRLTGASGHILICGLTGGWEAARIEFDGSGNARVRNTTGYTGTIFTTNDTNWHHMCAVMSTTLNNMLFYLDGVYKATVRTDNNGYAYRYLGYYYDTATNSVDVTLYKIFDTKLSLEEIVLDYEQSKLSPDSKVQLQVPADFTTDEDTQLELVWDAKQPLNIGRPPVDSNSKLLIESYNQIDGSSAFADSSPVGRVIVKQNSPVHDTDEYILSNSSIYVPRTAAIGAAYHSDFVTGTSDFTVRFWYKINSWTAGSYQVGGIISFRAANGWEVIQSNSYFLYLTESPASGTDSTQASFAPALDTWYYFEMTRTSNFIRFFIDGVYKGGGSHPETSGDPTSSRDFIIGRRAGWSDNDYGVDGWFQSIEFLSYSTRTSTASYTPPNEPVVTGYVGDLADKLAQQVYSADLGSVYTFNQDPATEDLLDHTGNGNDGTAVGTMLSEDLVEGFRGKGWDLEGTDDGVTTASNLGVTTYPFTFFAYFQVDDLTGDNPLISGDDASNYIGLSVIIGTSGEIIVRLGDGTGVTSADYKDWSSANGLIRADEDQTIVVVVRGFTDVELYVDSKLQTLTAGSATGTSADLSNALYRFGTSAADSDFFDGKIYEAFLYSDFANTDRVKLWHNSSLDNLWHYDYPEQGREPYQLELLLPAQSTEIENIPIRLFLDRRCGPDGFNACHIFDTLKPQLIYPSPTVTPAEVISGAPVNHWTMDRTRWPDYDDFSNDFTGKDGDSPDNFTLLHDSTEPSTGTATIQSNALRIDIQSVRALPYTISKFKIIGDFDIEVGISPSSTADTNRRWYFVVDDRRDSWLNGNWASIYADSSTPHYRTYNTSDFTDVSGAKYRMVRTGSSIVLYVWNGSSWVSKQTDASYGTHAVYVTFAVRTVTSTSYYVDFDDFIINYATNIEILVDEKRQVDGTIVGMTPTVGGPFNNYLAGGYCESVQRMVDFGSSGIGFTSLSFWFRRITTTQVEVLLDRGDSLRSLYISTDDILYLYNGSTGVSTGHTVSDTDWHHLVMIEGTSTSYHWVVLDSVYSSSQLLGDFGNSFRYMGQAVTAALQNVCDFSNFQVFDYILSATQVQELYETNPWPKLKIIDDSGTQLPAELAFYEQDNERMSIWASPTLLDVEQKLYLDYNPDNADQTDYISEAQQGSDSLVFDGNAANGSLNLAGYTYRMLIPASQLTGHNGKIRIRWLYYSSTHTIAEAWIYRDSPTGDVTDGIDGSGVQITTGGETSWTVTASENRYSDPIDFTITGDEGIVIAVYTAVGGGARDSNTKSGCATRFFTGNNAATADVGAGTSNSFFWHIEDIERIWNAPSWDVWPKRGDYTQLFDVGAPTNQQTTINNQTARWNIPAGSLTIDNTGKVRIRLLHYLADYSFASCYIGYHDTSGSAWDMESGSVVQVYFRGSASHTVTAIDYYSDPVDFVIDGSKSVVVSIGTYSNIKPYGSGIPTYYGFTTADAGTPDLGGMSTNGLPHIFRGIEAIPLELDVEYKARFGFNQDPSDTAPQLFNSTRNFIHGTSAGTMLTEDLVYADKLYGWDFEGTDDHVDFSSNLGLTDYPIVIGGRFHVDDLDNNHYLFVGSNGTNFAGIDVYVLTTGELAFQYGDGSGLTTADYKQYKTVSGFITAGVVYDFMLVITAFDSHTLYVNGVSYTLVNTTGTATSVDLINASYKCGESADGTVFFDGVIYDLYAGSWSATAEQAYLFHKIISDDLVTVNYGLTPIPLSPPSYVKPFNLTWGIQGRNTKDELTAGFKKDNIIVLLPQYPTFPGGSF